MPQHAPSSQLPLHLSRFSAGRQLTINCPPAPEASSQFLPHSLPPSPPPQPSPPPLLAWQYRRRRHRRAASPAAAPVALLRGPFPSTGHLSLALASSVEPFVCEGASSVRRPSSQCAL